ncbi:hypothetical protein O181_055609 [Austropuccinia psidii MF-1]|uniref:Reverse transcriptase/retrotransposon-derived protein RNase H-like domain-containing protein n=1 Tax=Austropuccinia psidii MF-1 TaxID=1389203 RepID=A0A9Q3E6V0_9BASI|nr:hypothetical protein [Austropuccinia psidii MF-1]
MSDSIINIKILRKCGGELEDTIKCRCVEPCSSEDYINAMEDIITRTRISKTWNRAPIESKRVPKISRDDKRPERPVLKCHKCGSTSHLANTCTKKTKIKEVQIIEEVQYTEEKEESDQDSAVSGETPVEDYSIENITAFFEVTEVHTHLPQYSEDFYSLIDIQDARMCAIEGNEVDITIDIDRTYPPVLRRPAYPASPRAIEALEKNIQEFIQLGVLRKVGHNEEVAVTTPVIIAWHNDESRMVGDFRALNTYTVPDRSPIPRIQETLMQFSKAKMQFDIKNAPSHYQRMINTIFPKELSEGWLIIYIDDIIICSYSWYLHLERLARVLDKATGVIMKISLKKCNFGFEELKALGYIVCCLSLGIDKNKVAAVLLKPLPQNKKEMMSFLGFSSYYRQHLKYFSILAKSLYRICDQQAVFEMTQESINIYQKIRKALTEAPLCLIPDWNIPFRLYVDACGDGLGEALHQVQIISDKPTAGPFCYIPRQIEPTEARWSAYV